MREDEKAALLQRIAAIEDAFPRDDLGKPAYHTHRQRHLADDKEAEKERLAKERDENTLADIKDDALKQMAKWLVRAALLALAAYFGIKGI